MAFSPLFLLEKQIRCKACGMKHYGQFRAIDSLLVAPYTKSAPIQALRKAFLVNEQSGTANIATV
ncbi:hypothetical protein D1872_325120 [compost metagenome]